MIIFKIPIGQWKATDTNTDMATEEEGRFVVALGVCIFPEQGINVPSAYHEEGDHYYPTPSGAG